MKSKILARDYKEELANIAEQKRFRQNAGNLLLSMLYKTEDSYDNYQNVKRETPSRDEFLEDIVETVRKYCTRIEIAEPHSELEKRIKNKKIEVIAEKNRRGKTIISCPNEKTLLFGVAKAGLPNISSRLSTTDKAILTTILIGKCISISEVIRDFNGWSWSILPKEIESTECNIIYILLTYLYGYKFINGVNSTNINTLKKNMPDKLWDLLEKVATQFYLAYDKNENEQVLKTLATYKTMLAKMKDQDAYLRELDKEKKKKLRELKKQYIAYNSKLKNEDKIFSVSHYEDLLQKRRKAAMEKVVSVNKMHDFNEFIKYRDELKLKVRFFESKTDISAFQDEFIKCFEKKVDATKDKKGITDLIYEVRYLNFIPNCKMKLTDIEKKLIPKAINARVINPISNNDDLDYRLLKGIFDSQVVTMEGLSIRLSACEEGINVEIFDRENSIHC